MRKHFQEALQIPELISYEVLLAYFSKVSYNIITVKYCQKSILPQVLHKEMSSRQQVSKENSQGQSDP